MSGTWGIIPAAGCGTRIQPLAFSKELLPVGSSITSGVERPRAICEYLVERMIEAGLDVFDAEGALGEWARWSGRRFGEDYLR